MFNSAPRWRLPSLIGVLVVAVLPLLLLFSFLMEWDHSGRMQPGGMVQQTMPMGRDSSGGNVGVSMNGKMLPPPNMPVSPSSDMMAQTSPSVILSGEQVANTASLDLRVQNIDWTVGKIREVVDGHGGFVENLSVNQPKFGEHTAWMTVKIPAKDFPSTYNELKKSVYSVVGESMGGSDLTQAYTNLQARLDNKQEEEKTLKTLLSQAVKISDVIEITDRITQVRTEIESLEAEKRSMDNQTQMASVSISMTEDPQIVADTTNFTSGNIFKRAVNDLIRSLTHFGSGLVVLLIAGVPIILIYLFIFWVIYFFTKKGVRKFFDR